MRNVIARVMREPKFMLTAEDGLYSEYTNKYMLLFKSIQRENVFVNGKEFPEKAVWMLNGFEEAPDPLQELKTIV